MIGGPGIFVEHGPVIIGFDGAAHLFEDILVAVVIDITKGNAVALLQMPEPAGGGHILEVSALGVAEHAIGNEHAEDWVARAHVKIEVPIVIEVAKVDAHRKQDFVQVRLVRNVGKSAVVIVVVKVRAFARGGQAQVIGRNIVDVVNVVAGDENVGPAIVVLVEEQRREAVGRLSYAGLGCHVGELPAALRAQGRIPGAVIAKEGLGPMPH